MPIILKISLLWLIAGMISTGLAWFFARRITHHSVSGSQKAYRPLKDAIKLLDRGISSGLDVMDGMEDFSGILTLDQELQKHASELKGVQEVLSKASQRLAEMKKRVNLSEGRLAEMKTAQVGRQEFLWHANLVCNTEHGLLQARIKLLQAVAEGLAQFSQSPGCADFRNHLATLSESLEYYRDTLKISQKRLASLNQDFDELEKNHAELLAGIMPE